MIQKAFSSKYRGPVLVSFSIVVMVVAALVLVPLVARPNDYRGEWTDANALLARYQNRLYTINEWHMDEDELVVISPREIDVRDIQKYVGLLVTAPDRFAADALRHRISMRFFAPVVFDYPREFIVIEIREESGVRMGRETSFEALAVRYRP